MPEKKIIITIQDDEPAADEVPAKRAEGWFLIALVVVGVVGWVAQHVF